MIDYIIKRYKFSFNEVIGEDDAKKIIHFCQMYSYALMCAPFITSYEEINTTELSDWQMYVANVVVEEYSNLKEHYYETDLLDFDYYKEKSKYISVVDPTWE